MTAQFACEDPSSPTAVVLEAIDPMTSLAEKAMDCGLLQLAASPAGAVSLPCLIPMSFLVLGCSTLLGGGLDPCI